MIGTLGRIAQVLPTYPPGAMGEAMRANDVITDIQNSAGIALADIEELGSRGVPISGAGISGALSSVAVISESANVSAANIGAAHAENITWDEAANENVRLRNETQRAFSSLGDILRETLGGALDRQLISKTEYDETWNRFAVVGGAKVPLWGWGAVALVAYVLLA